MVWLLVLIHRRQRFRMNDCTWKEVIEFLHLHWLWMLPAPLLSKWRLGQLLDWLFRSGRSRFPRWMSVSITRKKMYFPSPQEEIVCVTFIKLWVRDWISFFIYVMVNQYQRWASVGVKVNEQVSPCLLSIMSMLMSPFWTWMPETVLVFLFCPSSAKGARGSGRKDFCASFGFPVLTVAAMTFGLGWSCKGEKTVLGIFSLLPLPKTSKSAFSESAGWDNDTWASSQVSVE